MKRYSGRALPPYRHLPGATPHPERSPEGHLYGRVEPPPRPFTRELGSSNEDYLYGVDLFNAGYFWEAHTCWERLWVSESTEGSLRPFLRGLIQLAAACLKATQGRREGARKLLDRSHRNLARLGETTVLGIDLPSLERAALSYATGSGEPPRIDIS